MNLPPGFMVEPPPYTPPSLLSAPGMLQDSLLESSALHGSRAAENGDDVNGLAAPELAPVRVVAPARPRPCTPDTPAGIQAELRSGAASAACRVAARRTGPGEDTQRDAGVRTASREQSPATIRRVARATPISTPRGQSHTTPRVVVQATPRAVVKATPRTASTATAAAMPRVTARPRQQGPTVHRAENSSKRTSSDGEQ